MFRIGNIFTLLFTLMSAPIAFAQTSGQRFIPVAFYNLENFFHPDDNPETDDDDFTPEGSYRYTYDVFSRKAANLSKVIARLGTAKNPDGAALIGVCEVEDDKALKMLLQQPELKKRNYRFVRMDGSDGRGINVALLYNPRYFKMLNARNLNVNLRFAGGGRTRDVLLVEGVLAGDSVFVLVNHWPSRSGGQSASEPRRMAAAAVNRLAIEQILRYNPHARIIVMGDLNDDPNSPSITKGLKATPDTQRLQSDELYNPWMDYYRQGIGTLTHNNRWNLFDQILLSHEWVQLHTGTLVFHSAQVFNPDFIRNAFGKYKGAPYRSFSGTRWINGYSDHFPTIIYFTAR